MIPLPPTPSKKKSSFAPVELTCAPTKPALSLGISVWVMLKFGRTLRSISCSLLSTYSTNCHGKSLCLRQVEIKNKKNEYHELLPVIPPTTEASFFVCVNRGHRVQGSCAIKISDVFTL